VEEDLLDDAEDRDDTKERPRDVSEGVRIIGAEEAAEALERGDVARRRGDGVPRFGDRPESPAAEGPRPALRFPLGSSSDPTDIERPAVAPLPNEPVDMPHWTEPATGEVPAALRSDDEEDLDAWSSSVSSAPRWRDATTHESHDDFSDLADLGDDETRIGALDERDRPSEKDWFSFADLEPAQGRSVFAEADAGIEPGVDADEWTDLGPEVEPERAAVTRPAPRRRSTPQYAPRRGAGGGRAGGGERDMGQAIIVGVGFVVAALLLCSQGPAWAMVIVLPTIAVAAVELFSALRHAGYQPVTLAGLAAVIGLVLGAYHRGEAALPIVMVLTVVTCLLWYLFNAGGENPVLNIGATVLAVSWVGLFGSYAALLLRAPDGVGLFLGAIAGTVAYDVGGLFIGRNAGRQPLSPASPNKTVEGLVGGCVVAIIVSVVYASAVAPFDGIGDGIKLGLVIAIAAPLGDLCESLVKRDLGVKDMGSLLPGHGGFLDRFDATLFVLPAVWYLARLTDFFS
jgi:phosphatidate cytidylyltransferase